LIFIYKGFYYPVLGSAFGDKLFEEEYGDDQTPFREHGSRYIVNKEDAMESARRFALSTS